MNKSRNPLVDLPCAPEDVLDGIEMALVSHLHFDHFDPLAHEMLPKDMPLFCQPDDAQTLEQRGFQRVKSIIESAIWHSMGITRTPGQHGTGEWRERMGTVSGFIFRAKGEPGVYWMGDTIWYEGVRQVIAETKPDIIITHSSGARFDEGDPIVMDAVQTVAVCRAAPDATVIATHMDALDHGTVTRSELRAYAESQGISAEQLRIPADGETLTF